MESSAPKGSGNSKERDNLLLSVQAKTWMLHVSTTKNINWALLRKWPN